MDIRELGFFLEAAGARMRRAAGEVAGATPSKVSATATLYICATRIGQVVHYISLQTDW